MGEMKMETKDLCEQKELLMNWLKMMTLQGPENVDINELEKLANSVHYLAETIQCCAETQYYEAVKEAMDEKKEEDERWGYNMNHYKNGRFASTPSMPRSGFRPYLDQEPYIDEYLNNPQFSERMRMGYSGGSGNSGNNGNGYGNSGSGNSNGSRNNSGYSENGDQDAYRYGKAYSDYKSSKRYYTQTKSEIDKNEMQMNADSHLANCIATMREIWKDAEAEHRKRMKTELSAFVNEMNT